MTQIVLPLVTGILGLFGCGTIPGQDVRYEPTPMPVVRALLELADVGPQDLVYDLGFRGRAHPDHRGTRVWRAWRRD
jgi:hypothetical protein